VHIEDIQDQVELALMRSGEHKVARAYVLYREEQARKRAEEAAQRGHGPRLVAVTLDDGTTRPLDIERLRRLVDEACAGSRPSMPSRSSKTPAQPVRRRQRERRLPGAGDERPHADRERARLLLRRRPVAAGHAASRGAGLPGPGHRRRDPGEMGERYATTSPPTSSAPATWNCSTSADPVRPRPPWARR
jgi:hypothetical protein